MAAGEQTFVLTVNGVEKRVTAHPMARLLDVLREKLRLTGTKEGCGEGECGACSVLLDDVLVNSCLVPMIQAQGRKVTTIEGASACRELPVLQQAFLECGGAQCGICTPGMIMASVALLREKASPSEEEIREGLAGNLCRCTGYSRIIDSVARAAEHLQEAP